MANTHVYTKKEEIANAISHGIGVPLSIAALVLLLIKAAGAGTASHIVSASIYGSTMFLLYMASTLVHSFPEGRVKDLFEIFDHSAIYLFIAGTYTPILFHVIQGPLGWTLFGAIWFIAIAGVAFKSFFTKRFLFTSTLFYIVMGWMIVFAWEPLTTRLAGGGLTLLVVGGLLYTLGTIFYVWRKFPFHHMVWHLFVLAGSTFHFFAILIYVLP